MVRRAKPSTVSTRAASAGCGGRDYSLQSSTALAASSPFSYLDGGSFRVIGTSAAHPQASVLIASLDDANRFVLADCALRKGLRVIVVHEIRGIWAALRREHAIRLVLYTPDAIGAAATEAVCELVRKRWFVAQVPSELRLAMPAGADTNRTAAPAGNSLWQTIDCLLEATSHGELGAIVEAGPRVAELAARTGNSRADEDLHPTALGLACAQLVCGPIVLDVLNDRAFIDGARREEIRGSLFQLLKYLMRRPGQRVPWSEVDDAIFGVRMRSRAAHRKTAQRLRSAMRERGTLVIADSSGIQIQLSPAG
jgi:hypothetical protein